MPNKVKFILIALKRWHCLAHCLFSLVFDVSGYIVLCTQIFGPRYIKLRYIELLAISNSWKILFRAHCNSRKVVHIYVEHPWTAAFDVSNFALLYRSPQVLSLLQTLITFRLHSKELRSLFAHSGVQNEVSLHCFGMLHSTCKYTDLPATPPFGQRHQMRWMQNSSNLHWKPRFVSMRCAHSDGCPRTRARNPQRYRLRDLWPHDVTLCCVNLESQAFADCCLLPPRQLTAPSSSAFNVSVSFMHLRLAYVSLHSRSTCLVVETR